MPLSGWVMFGFFLAVIFAGIGLAVRGWRYPWCDRAEQSPPYGLPRPEAPNRQPERG